MLGNFMNIFFDGTLEESSERQVRETTPGVIEKVVQSPNLSLKSIRKMLKPYERGMERILKTGLCIEITLKELLEICPRERKRTDAYTGLVSYLSKELGIKLTIKSQKI